MSLTNKVNPFTLQSHRLVQKFKSLFGQDPLNTFSPHVHLPLFQVIKLEWNDDSIFFPQTSGFVWKYLKHRRTVSLEPSQTLTLSVMLKLMWLDAFLSPCIEVVPITYEKYSCLPSLGAQIQNTKYMHWSRFDYLWEVLWSQAWALKHKIQNMCTEIVRITYEKYSSAELGRRYV